MQKLFLSKNDTSYPALLLTFGSGFTSLVYELVWMRILSVLFGRTTIAVTIVVAAYMAGLGLGTIFWGNRVDRETRYMKIFGFMQCGIAATALITLLLFGAFPPLYKFLYQQLSNSRESSIVIMTVMSFVVMLGPVFIMGGTLPVLSKIVIKTEETIGRGIAVLYAVNTLGGIIGAAGTGFLLIRYLGQTQTLLLAICINLLCGFTALNMRSRHATVSDNGNVTNQKSPQRNRLNPRFYLLLASVTGFGGIAFEIVSVRAASIFLVNSTYSFSSVLIVFLSGISLGSFLFTILQRKKVPLLRIGAPGLIAAGLYVMGISLFLNELPLLLDPFASVMNRLPFIKIAFPALFLSFVILFVPTLLLGICFPLFCTLYTTNVKEIGKRFSRIYFVNTLGSIAGSITGGLIIIPVLGVVKGMVILGVLFLVAGMTMTVPSAAVKRDRKAAAVLFGTTVISILIILRAWDKTVIHPPSVFRCETSTDSILYYNETSAGTVLVRKDQRTALKTLYVNNSEVCGVTYDALKVVKMLGHIPFLVNPAIKDVLIIGLGIGVTAAEVAKNNIRSIECVEICPGVKEAAALHFGEYNDNVISDTRITFFDADGRSHLLLSDKKYDMISCDPTHPTLGSGNLYTREYFQLCKQHLTADGVVTHYLPLHRLSPRDFAALIKTFHSVFPHTTVWLGHLHCVLVGANHPYTIDFSAIQRYCSNFNDIMIRDPYQMTASLFLDENAVASFTDDSRVHTDNKPFLEFYTAESIRKENWHLNLAALVKSRVDPSRCIYNITDTQTFTNYLIGQNYFLNGLIVKNMGNQKKGDELFEKALQINPGNTDMEHFLLYERWRQSQTQSEP